MLHINLQNLAALVQKLLTQKLRSLVRHVDDAAQAVSGRKQVEGLVDLGQGQLVRDVLVHFDLLHV